MTREEAKDLLKRLDNFDKPNVAFYFESEIDKLYDEFEKQLENKNKTIEAIRLDNIKLSDELEILKEKLGQEKHTLKDYKFTNCNDCIHKVDNRFTETCMSCKRYYGCYFEKRKDR